MLNSSTVTMSLTAFPWAHYTHEKGTIKLHTLLDLPFDSFCELDLPEHEDQHILKDEIIFLKNKATYSWHMSNLVDFLHMNIFVKINLWQ